MRATSARRRADNKTIGNPRRHNGGAGAGRLTDFNSACAPATTPTGFQWCETCRQLVPVRESDGRIRAHKSRSGVSCSGAVPSGKYLTAGLCSHGNAPRERKGTCGCPFRTAAVSA